MDKIFKIASHANELIQLLLLLAPVFSAAAVFYGKYFAHNKRQKDGAAKLTAAITDGVPVLEAFAKSTIGMNSEAGNKVVTDLTQKGVI